MNKDSLGDRMKQNYENRTQLSLPRRTYTILRLDGKAFHTYTKNMERPFDENLIARLDAAAVVLMEEMMGAQFAYLYSDEISVLITDFGNEQTCAWFDGNIQKMVSISASIVSVMFSLGYPPAHFDSRVFTIPDPVEVENYFIWRQKDCVNNSIQMVAQSLYPHKALHSKKVCDLQDMIVAAGKNWNNYPPMVKRGRAIVKESFTRNEAVRSRWVVSEVPIFTKVRSWLQERIPSIHVAPSVK